MSRYTVSGLIISAIILLSISLRTWIPIAVFFGLTFLFLFVSFILARVHKSKANWTDRLYIILFREDDDNDEDRTYH
jgi:uncharacterized membrane protein